MISRLMSVWIAVVLLTVGCGEGRDLSERQVQRDLEAKQLRPKPGWPTLFGPYHNSISSETGLNLNETAGGPAVHWRKRIGSGYSVPVVLNGRLILFHRIEDEEIISCLDAETGDSLWEFSYPTAYECLYEYSNGPYATPVINQGRVYSIGAEGKMFCMDLETGMQVWKRDLKRDFEIGKALFGMGASPLVEDGRVIVNVGGTLPDSGIVAFDAETGGTLWQATDDGPSYCTPKSATIHGKKYVLALTYEGLVGLDPVTGEVFFQEKFRPTAVDTVNATSPLVIDDKVFVAAGPGPGCRLYKIEEDGSANELWRERRALDSQFNNLIALNGFAYGYTSKWNGGATFNCVRLEDGELMWKFPSDLVRGSSIAVEDRFILWGEHGHLAVMKINPREPELVWMTEKPLLKSPCYTAPALNDGLLYLRNEREILCLDLRNSSKSARNPE